MNDAAYFFAFMVAALVLCFFQYSQWSGDDDRIGPAMFIHAAAALAVSYGFAAIATVGVRMFETMVRLP